MYFLGIDGGGTKTCFTLINEKGNVINRVIKGTCHPTQIGFDNLEKLLREGLEEIIKSSNISKEEITKIAELKMPDLNAGSLEAAISMIAGTARSMGITVQE